jgi:hypothetical protein
MSDDIAEHTKALIAAALATPGALGMAWENAGSDERKKFVVANKVGVLELMPYGTASGGRLTPTRSTSEPSNDRAPVLGVRVTLKPPGPLGGFLSAVPVLHQHRANAQKPNVAAEPPLTWTAAGAQPCPASVANTERRSLF